MKGLPQELWSTFRQAAGAFARPRPINLARIRSGQMRRALSLNGHHAQNSSGIMGIGGVETRIR